MPNSARPISSETRKAPARLRSVNTRGGSSGSAVLRSITTNAASSTTAAISRTMVLVADQPLSLALVKP